MNSQFLKSISQNCNTQQEVIAQKNFYEKIHEKALYHHSVKKISDTEKKIFDDNDDIFLVFDNQKLNIVENKVFPRYKYIKQAVLYDFDISNQLPELKNDWLAGGLTSEEVFLNLFNRIQDLYENYNITEYQPVAKHIYEIQDKPFRKLINETQHPLSEESRIYLQGSLNYYFEVLTDKERFNLRAVKMKYNNFISGNYDVIANYDNTFDIIECDFPAFINSLATNIIQTREIILDPQQAMKNKFHAFNNLLNDLSKTINEASIKDTANTEITVQQMLENSTNFYKQVSSEDSAYTKYFYSFIIEENINKLTSIPKFKDNDTFYLLFEKRPLRCGNYHSHNGQHLKINEQYKPTATDKKILETIIAELNYYPYDFKFGFPAIYAYPPECYQSIAKFCYDLESINYNDDLLGYNQIIKKDWRAAKITYGDYITGNYKVVLDSNLQRIIATKDEKFKDLLSKLAVVVKECKSFINDYAPEEYDASVEDINTNMEYKLSVLQALLIPINTQYKACTIKDFCLSANLTIGATFLESAKRFKKYSS
jgi:hypothetical protein